MMCAALAGWGAAAPPAFAQDDAPVATVGEVVVTAQRKEENLVDVPISMAVVSGEVLENANVATIVDIPNLAVGVSYNTNFGGGFQIRGVGTQSVTSTGEQSVSIMVDDVVQGIPEISFAGPSYQALTDIERVEVLRGPQGTLFGKNSSAGVLQIITVRPALGEFRGDTSVSYGTDNELKITTNVNIPIGETAAARISAYKYSRDGFVHNHFTGEDVSGYDNYGVRAKLLWQPNDVAELYLIASHQENNDTGNGIWTIRSCGSGFNGFSACDEVAEYGVVPGEKNLAGAWDGALGVKAINNSISGRITYDLGWATLKSITAYYTVDIKEDVEVDSSPLPILSVNHNEFHESQFTQEVRLEGDYNNLSYTLGGFYYDAEVLYPGLQAGTFNFLPDDSPILLTSGVGGPVPCCISVMDSETTSLAAFGQATLHLFDDRLALTGGLRYTQDDVALDNYALDAPNICQIGYAFGAPCKPAVGLPSPVLRAEIDAEDVSGKVSAMYAVTPDINVYATYSTGYKGPLISYPRGQPLLPVDPETVENYEVGLKGEFFERRLLATLAVFRTVYSNFQGQTLRVDPTNPANRSLVTTNAGGLKTSGFEVDLRFQVTPELSVRGGYAYTPTEFTEFAIPCNDRFTNPATVPGECTYRSPQAPDTLQFNAKGYPLPYAPENSFNMGAHYLRPIAHDMEFELFLNYSWRDETYTAVADPGSVVPSYGLLSMNIGVGPQDQSWRMNLFARNLLDEYYVSGIFRTPLDTGSAGSTPLSTIGYANIPAIDSSRTVGVKLEVNF